MKPPFAYYGGKTGLARRIAALLPPHRTYIEPFLGSGAVLFAKPRVPNEIVNDVDHNLVTFFRVLRERTDELVDVCSLTPHAREEYDLADLAGELDDLERARRFWVRGQPVVRQDRRPAHRLVCHHRAQPVRARLDPRGIARFGPAAERLMHCTIECCDAADLIDRLATPDTAIYADPPYLATTRRGRERYRRGDYAHDMGDDAGHGRLAEALHATPAAVVLSGYPSPLYEDLYADWARVEIPVLAHSSNAVTAERGERTEVLWSNRPLNAGTLFEVPA